MRATGIRVYGALLICAALLHLNALAAAPADTARLLEFYVPADLLFPKLSPKGDMIGFLARAGDATGVGICDLKSGNFRLVGQGMKELPVQFWWKGDRRLLVRTALPREGGIGYLALDVDGGKQEDLWRLARVGTILDALPEDPRHVLMVSPDLLGAAVVKVRLPDADTRIIENPLPGVQKWFVDGHGHVRAAFGGVQAGERTAWWKAPGSKTWQKRRSTSREVFMPLGFDRDPRFLYAWDSTAGEESTIVRLDTLTEEASVIVRRAGYDPTEMIRIGLRDTIIGANFHQLGEAPISALQSADETALAAMMGKFAGFRVKPLDVLPDSRIWFLEVSNSRNPGTFLLFDTTSGGVALIGAAHGSRLQEASLTQGQAVSFANRHGQKLTGTLWRTGTESTSPLVIILPTDLPFLPSSDSYDPDVQALATSGFSVAKINARGTYGFGRTFAAAAETDVAVCLREDLEDAVDHLAAQHGIDRKRVALFGKWTGGVLALALGASSERFAAVINVNAPVEFGPEGLRAFTAQEDTMRISDQLGGWKRAKQFAKELSPIHTAPRCQMPALHLYDTIDAGGDSIGISGQTLRKAIDKAGVPGRFAGAYPTISKGRTLTQVSSDHAVIMTKIVTFLHEVF